MIRALRLFLLLIFIVVLFNVFLFSPELEGWIKIGSFDSPILGIYIFSSSSTFLARFILSKSASLVNPPARSTTSMTLSSLTTSYTPGLKICPLIWTIIIGFSSPKTVREVSTGKSTKASVGVSGLTKS